MVALLTAGGEKVKASSSPMGSRASPWRSMSLSPLEPLLAWSPQTMDSDRRPTEFSGKESYCPDGRSEPGGVAAAGGGTNATETRFGDAVDAERELLLTPGAASFRMDFGASFILLLLSRMLGELLDVDVFRSGNVAVAEVATGGG